MKKTPIIATITLSRGTNPYPVAKGAPRAFLRVAPIGTLQAGVVLVVGPTTPASPCNFYCCAPGDVVPVGANGSILTHLGFANGLDIFDGCFA